MNKLTIPGILLAWLVGAAAFAQEAPDFPSPQAEHQWLTQLAGEWTYDIEMFTTPGGAPFKSTGTESVRSIGGFWTLAENKGNFGGAPFTGLMTLGYDTDKRKYVGTWVDSMTSYLWKYEGTVDKSGKLLTLKASGPCHLREGKLTDFEETIEIKGPDRKVFTSFILDDDGKRTKMMQIDYHRKK